MEAKKIPRRNAIPILYTKGTHYDVGFDMGRTFASIIKSFLQLYQPLSCTYLRLYDTPKGKEVYNETLEAVKKSFPQYVRELQGIADGAQVEFHKLFLLHLDEILPEASSVQKEEVQRPSMGCSTVMINRHDCQLIGHTEDALSETLNHFYFVDAHIVSDTPQGKYRVREERFFSLCYAGCLPGYTMSYNQHGLVFSINTISAKHLKSGKIPRTFLTRALLAAERYEQAELILRDVGVGAADGCTVNMAFVKRPCEDTEFYNIEVGPATDLANESQLDIKQICIGQYNYHCNKYLRLTAVECNEYMRESSVHRMNAFCSYSPPKSKAELIKMLGDTSTKPHTVFRENGDLQELVKTIAVGIFDLQHKTLALYSDNPRKNDPLVILPLHFGDISKKCDD